MSIKEKYKKLPQKTQKRIKILGVLIAILLFILFKTHLVEKENKYLEFTKSYFNLIKMANVDVLASKTSDVSLYKKIGEFNLEVCTRSLGKEKIYEMLNEYNSEYEYKKDKISDEQRIEEVSKHMNSGCKSNGAYEQYKNYFDNITAKPLIISKDEYGNIRLSIKVYSKWLSKTLNMVAVIEEKGDGLYMKDLEFFPDSSLFIEKVSKK